MKNTAKKLFGIFFAYILSAMILHAEDSDVFSQKVRYPKSKGTVYELLMKIADYSGYQFVYDSNIINSNEESFLPKGQYTLTEAVHTITKNHRLLLEKSGNHILLYLKIKEPEALPDSNTYFIIEGNLRDKLNEQPIPYVFVNVDNTSIGTVSNNDGYFKLKLPGSLSQSKIHLFHIGYENQIIDVSFLRNKFTTFTLKPQSIVLKEAVIHIQNPMKILSAMREHRKRNYADKPVYQTSFYREGFNIKDKAIDLTEAVFKIYKSEFGEKSNQVKLLKMRKVMNKSEIIFFVTKLKSGINSSLMLDIIKESIDFLEFDENNSYRYHHIGNTTLDDKPVYVITFEQNEFKNFPHYKGKLYIDAERYALLQADFEIHPRFIALAKPFLVSKTTRDIKINPQSVKYTVNYKLVGDKYYINHVRGDLHFKARKKNKLTSSDLHTWFEMLTCDIDTVSVSRFSRHERISTNTIFTNTKFIYDDKFWGNFNVIMPEKALKESVLLNLSKESSITLQEISE